MYTVSETNVASNFLQ